MLLARSTPFQEFPNVFPSRKTPPFLPPHIPSQVKTPCIRQIRHSGGTLPSALGLVPGAPEHYGTSFGKLLIWSSPSHFTDEETKAQREKGIAKATRNLCPPNTQATPP